MKKIPNIGIDFGGTTIRFALIQETQILSEIVSIPTQDIQTPSQFIQSISDFLNEKKPHQIQSIGIGVPGFVNFETGFIYDLINVSKWENIPLKKELENQLNIPVVIDNDANCMAYAEWKEGLAKGMENFIGITIGTGIGAGIFINNQLVRGHHGMAGEIGQTSIKYEGIAGKYQNSGALEKYAGKQAIIEYANSYYQKKGKKLPQETSPKNLAEMAENGDKIANEIWQDIGKKIAFSLSNYCWLLNPEAIILGGGIANAGKILLNSIEKNLKKSLHPKLNGNIKITKAKFQENAGIIGASLLARDYRE